MFHRLICALAFAALLLAGCDGKRSSYQPTPAGGGTNGPTSKSDSGNTDNPVTGPIDKAKWVAVKGHMQQMATALKMYGATNGKLPDELRPGMTADQFGPLVGYNDANGSERNGFSASDFVLESVDPAKKTFFIRASSSGSGGPKGTVTVDQTCRVSGP